MRSGRALSSLGPAATAIPTTQSKTAIDRGRMIGIPREIGQADNLSILPQGMRAGFDVDGTPRPESARGALPSMNRVTAIRLLLSSETRRIERDAAGRQV